MNKQAIGVSNGRQVKTPEQWLNGNGSQCQFEGEMKQKAASHRRNQHTGLVKQK